MNNQTNNNNMMSKNFNIILIFRNQLWNLFLILLLVIIICLGYLFYNNIEFITLDKNIIGSPNIIENNTTIVDLNEIKEKDSSIGIKKSFFSFITSSNYYPSQFQPMSFHSKVESLPSSSPSQFQPMSFYSKVELLPSSSPSTLNIPPVNRTLPPLNLPSVNSTLPPLHEQLASILEQLNSYELQWIKFSNIIWNIENGTENFYPPESISEFETNLKVIECLVENLRSSADNLIAQQQAIDPNYIPPGC